MFVIECKQHSSALLSVSRPNPEFEVIPSRRCDAKLLWPTFVFSRNLVYCEFIWCRVEPLGVDAISVIDIHFDSLLLFVSTDYDFSVSVRFKFKGDPSSTISGKKQAYDDCEGQDEVCGGEREGVLDEALKHGVEFSC